MKWQNTLMSFERDVKSRSFLDWLEAHTSFMKPLHRYVGTLELKGEKLIFRGRDVKKNDDFNLEIVIKDILDVHLGFDKVFRKREDRQLGVRSFVPLRISYKSKAAEKKVYVFANFHHSKYGWRASGNRELYEKLNSYLW